jgi:hypothetical protein
MKKISLIWNYLFIVFF